MADFASIPGGGTLPADTNTVDMFYRIDTGGTFLDRSGSLGHTTSVDASQASDGVMFKGSIGDNIFVGSAGSDVVTGFTGNDSISLGAGNNHGSGGAGNDTMNAGNGNDTIVGDAGNDLLFGGNGTNNLQGGDGNDTVLGGTDADMISGGAGNDELWGGAGNDTIVGGDGNDYMFGDKGNDLLMGGSGSDTFVYDGGYGGHDTISGFTVGQDQIEIKEGMGGIHSLDDLAGKITVTGNTAKITIGDDTIVIKGITGDTSQLLDQPGLWIKIGTH